MEKLQWKKIKDKYIKKIENLKMKIFLMRIEKEIQELENQK